MRGALVISLARAGRARGGASQRRLALIAPRNTETMTKLRTARPSTSRSFIYLKFTYLALRLLFRQVTSDVMKTMKLNYNSISSKALRQFVGDDILMYFDE